MGEDDSFVGELAAFVFMAVLLAVEVWLVAWMFSAALAG